MQERRLREEEAAARLAAGRQFTFEVQRIRPTGRDIVPFRTYALPGRREVLDCPISKSSALLAMFDPITGEPNRDLRMALEMKRTKDFLNKHAQSEAALYSRSQIIHMPRHFYDDLNLDSSNTELRGKMALL